MGAPEDSGFHDRVVVVLVRARNPSNIGAAARAMHDLGYAQLRIVNEFPVPFAAAKSAVDASSVLLKAMEAGTLAAAVEDCTFVLGTTAVGERALEHPLHLLPQAVELIRDSLASDRQARVALVFGSEKTGLSNEELSHCHALLTIPMNAPADGRHLSMNLGQAVAVCLYALNVARPNAGCAPASFVPAPETLAPAGDIERLTCLLQEVLLTSGYSRRNPAGAREVSIRRLVRRLQLSSVDAPVWTGIFRQILFRLPRSEATAALPSVSSEGGSPDGEHEEQVG